MAGCNICLSIAAIHGHIAIVNIVLQLEAYLYRVGVLGVSQSELALTHTLHHRSCHMLDLNYCQHRSCKRISVPNWRLQPGLLVACLSKPQQRLRVAQSGEELLTAQNNLYKGRLIMQVNMSWSLFRESRFTALVQACQNA